MTPLAALSFFAIMLALAAMPSASVTLVVARSVSHGLKNGIAVALGIVIGDLFFVAFAILGMSVLATTFGSVFSVFKYIGGAYLVWLGFNLLKTNDFAQAPSDDSRRSTLLASFASGLFLTLGDLKAILFYASLFPTLMDLSSLTAVDIVIIVVVTILAVGGVKVIYAFTAGAIVTRLRSQRARQTQKIAGGLMVGTGAYLIIKA